MEINWKDYIKMPLKEDTFSDSLIKVYTAEHEMAFDFPMHFIYKHEEMIHLSYEMKKSFIQLINGQEIAPFMHQYKLTYNPNDTIIYADGKAFIIIRGWGHLTGSGGLGLDEDTAVAIQTGFANHIIESLNNYRVFTQEQMKQAFEAGDNYRLYLDKNAVGLGYPHDKDIPNNDVIDKTMSFKAWITKQ